MSAAIIILIYQDCHHMGTGSFFQMKLLPLISAQIILLADLTKQAILFIPPASTCAAPSAYMPSSLYPTLAQKTLQRVSFHH